MAGRGIRIEQIGQQSGESDVPISFVYIRERNLSRVGQVGGLNRPRERGRRRTAWCLCNGIASLCDKGCAFAVCLCQLSHWAWRNRRGDMWCQYRAVQNASAECLAVVGDRTDYICGVEI